MADVLAVCARFGLRLRVRSENQRYSLKNAMVCRVRSWVTPFSLARATAAPWALSRKRFAHPFDKPPSLALSLKEQHKFLPHFYAGRNASPAYLNVPERRSDRVVDLCQMLLSGDLGFFSQSRSRRAHCHGCGRAPGRTQANVPAACGARRPAGATDNGGRSCSALATISQRCARTPWLERHSLVPSRDLGRLVQRLQRPLPVCDGFMPGTECLRRTGNFYRGIAFADFPAERASWGPRRLVTSRNGDALSMPASMPASKACTVPWARDGKRECQWRWISNCFTTNPPRSCATLR